MNKKRELENNHLSAFRPLQEVQTQLTRLALSSFCVSTARSIASRNCARVTVIVCRQTDRISRTIHRVFHHSVWYRSKYLPLQTARGPERVTS